MWWNEYTDYKIETRKKSENRAKLDVILKKIEDAKDALNKVVKKIVKKISYKGMSNDEMLFHMRFDDYKRKKETYEYELKNDYDYAY